MKEKGFDEPCYAEYYVPTKEFNHFEYEGNNNENYKEWITAPTLQMAMKWLRKEHNLCIVSLPVVTDDEGEGGCLWKYTISMKLKVLFDSGNLYESPEIALDDAIKRCSENLI